MDETAVKRLEGNAYRNGVRDQLEVLIAHATVGVMVGRGAVPAGGTMAAVAAGITKKTVAFWFDQLQALPDALTERIFTEHRAANNGEEAPIVKGGPRS